MARANSAAETVASNEDLLIEILLLLPVKPLLRFKSVSKRWLSYISSPQFCNRHARRNPNLEISGFLLRKTVQEFEFLPLNGSSSGAPMKSLDFVHEPAGLKILQSCNGLLLCASLRSTGNIRKYYVFNPTTKRFATLPSLIGDPSTAIFGVNLAFDPCRSPHYKVICVRNNVASVYYYEIEIYSSEIGEWRVCGSPFVAPFDMVFDSGELWNDGIHWISPTGNSLRFDVERERLGKMPSLPSSGSWGKKKYRYFGGCRRGLHLIEIYGPCATQFKIYEMERDYSSWFVKYQVDLEAMIGAYPETVQRYLDPSDSIYYYLFAILSLVCAEKEDETSLLLHIPGKIISYNISHKSLKKLCDLGPTKGSLQFGWLDAYPYIESLASV